LKKSEKYGMLLYQSTIGGDKMKSKILRREGFFVSGVADLNLWGGGKGSIEMKPFACQHIREARGKLNDNGFGVEKINGAICDVFRLYENGYKEFARTVRIGNVAEYAEESYYYGA
jgi:hypothetical protein